ncbi:hypothetical protein KSP39_PZI021911 [Platanthera zijinensis]|uniref:Uncharacterized protein n=1 Tax=Platanthera zijinensis TaxID=2320716 RepID=A0AAP0FW39_9ASPA
MKNGNEYPIMARLMAGQSGRHTTTLSPRWRELDETELSPLAESASTRWSWALAALPPPTGEISTRELCSPIIILNKQRVPDKTDPLLPVFGPAGLTRQIRGCIQSSPFARIVPGSER